MGVAGATTRVLVVGSGAREHALAWACRRERADVVVACAPGNAGTDPLGPNLAATADDPASVVDCARQFAADLVVIGPDAALAGGVADACAASGFAVFGPTAAAARIESSKTFAKELMDVAGIPTSRWRAGHEGDRESLLAFARDLDGRCVVKADGLALGKGVQVCDGVDEARAALAACFDERRFGDAGTVVIVEERLSGAEVTVLALTDGEHVRVLPTSRDYKRIGDGDTGPNTGGMGAMSPAPGLDEDLLASIERDVLQPCIGALADRGTPFSGCLYAQLMLTPHGPRVVEFNARFGDPEAQVVLPLCGDGVLELLVACARGELGSGRVAASDHRAAVGVVLAAAGYPGPPRTGDAVDGLAAQTLCGDDVLVFHAGTRRDAEGTVRTAGGRVLTIVGLGDSVELARERAYAGASAASFDGAQRREDIAAID